MAKLLWHNSIHESNIEEAPLPVDQGVLCNAKYSLISLGTERLIAQGKVPFSSFETMAVPYMRGDFGLPIHYGYSIVAEVVEPNHPKKGTFVHALHPHADSFRIAEEDLFYLEEGVDLKRAALISNMETAVNAIWDAEIQLGDKVLICGYGLIGALVAELCRSIPGVTIEIAEVNASRKKLLLENGFSSWKGTDFDVAFNCSAHEEGLQICIDQVGYEGKVVEMSWYGLNSVNINLGGDFHYLRKRIISSQVSQIPTHKKNRWDYKRRKKLVCELLKQPTYASLIDHEIDFKDSPAFFNSLRSNQLNHLTCLIKY